MGRKNAFNRTVLSAEPYNYFEDINETKECLRTFDLVVQFQSPWRMTSEDIKTLLQNTKVKNDSIEAIGRKYKFKKILITFKE